MRAIVLGLIFGCFLILPSRADEAADSLAKTEQAKKNADMRARFYRMYPDFVTNLHNDVPTFLLIRIEVLMQTPEQVKIIEYHEPYLRDEVILFLNDLTPEEMRDMRKRNAIAQDIKKLMNQRLKAVESDAVIKTISLGNIIIE